MNVSILRPIRILRIFEWYHNICCTVCVQCYVAFSDVMASLSHEHL